MMLAKVLPSPSFLQSLPSSFHPSLAPFLNPLAPLLPWNQKSQANRDGNTEWANKKVVLFAVPGAFTPSCSVKHLPGYIENLSAIKAKGVDVVAVIAYNDAFVMSAWSKANGIKNDDIVCTIVSRLSVCKTIADENGTALP
jgi:peroxiredoxin